MTMPDVDKENYMSDEFEHVSRQTIRNWVRYLERENLIMRDSDDCNYYAVNRYPNGERYLTPISREIYKEGWRVYWEHAKEYDSFYAYYKASKIWGGAACRTPKIIINGIEWARTKRLKTNRNDAIGNFYFFQTVTTSECVFCNFFYRFSFVFAWNLQLRTITLVIGYSVIRPVLRQLHNAMFSY